MITSTSPVAPPIDTTIRGNPSLPNVTSRFLGNLVRKWGIACAHTTHSNSRVKWIVHSRRDRPGNAQSATSGSVFARSSGFEATKTHLPTKTHLKNAPRGQGAVT